MKQNAGLANVLGWGSIAAAVGLVLWPGSSTITQHPLFWPTLVVGVSAWATVWLSSRRLRSSTYGIAFAVGSTAVLLETIAVGFVGLLFVVDRARRERTESLLCVLAGLTILMIYRTWRVERQLQEIKTLLQEGLASRPFSEH